MTTRQAKLTLECVACLSGWLARSTDTPHTAAAVAVRRLLLVFGTGPATVAQLREAMCERHLQEHSEPVTQDFRPTTRPGEAHGQEKEGE
jgi:hypothetical protein